MPTRAKTSLDAIIAAGRAAVSRGGADALTMEHVASAVGVRAPSLYKRVQNRSDLVRLVVEDVLRELARTLEAAAGTGDPADDLHAMARAFRAFARSQPHAFDLLFSGAPHAPRPDPELLVATIDPVLRAAEALAGSQHALPAARTFTAWVTGFVRMELAGAFQMAGDVDEAFEYGARRLTLALALD